MRLGWVTGRSGDMGLGGTSRDAGDSGLGGTSGETGDSELGWTSGVGETGKHLQFSSRVHTVHIHSGEFLVKGTN